MPRDTPVTLVNTTAATLDTNFVAPLRPSNGKLDMQLTISAAASITVYGRLSSDQPWIPLSSSPYTSSVMLQQPWVPLMRVTVTGNTGTVALLAWAI